MKYINNLNICKKTRLLLFFNLKIKQVSKNKTDKKLEKTKIQNAFIGYKTFLLSQVIRCKNNEFY